MKVVIASGYFDPLHIGHIEYLKKSKEIGDILIVIVNNDDQLELKRGDRSNILMDECDRLIIINSLKFVDEAILSIDTDASVCKTIKHIKSVWNNKYKFIFAKGGDRNIYNIPEFNICKKLNIDIIDGLGKKIRNSSDFLEKRREL